MPSPRYVKATYTPAELPEYKGNPLIEALPPTLPRGEALKILRHPRPLCSPQERTKDAQYRLKAIRRIRDLFTVLPVHYDLYQRVTGMVEWGYKSRNPLLPGASGSLQKRIKDLEEAVRTGIPGVGQVAPSSAHGFTMIGVSGIGKSTAIRRILAEYPQIISHTVYNGRMFLVPQVVYLHLECPANKTLKGLCQSFVSEIDALLPKVNYYEQYGCERGSTEALSIAMARVARNHHLGVLVIDEIQNLRTKNGQDEMVLNFLVEIVNKLNIPVIMIGTPDALDVLSKFRQVRRGTGEGDLSWDRMREDSPEWDLVVKDLWRYQYTANKAELTDEFRKALYDESQGITDLAVKAFALTQVRAILNRSEVISVELMRQTAREVFSMCQSALAALRNGEETALKRFEDASMRRVLEASWFDDHWKAGLAALERQESLRLITEYQEVASAGADKVSQVAAWLVDGGVDPETAVQLAERALDKLGVDATLPSLRQLAYQFSESPGTSGEHSGSPGKRISKKGATRRAKKTPNSTDDDGLVNVVRKGQQEGKNPYEALRDAGLTLSSSEIDDEE